jgi:hypothetical protein
VSPPRSSSSGITGRALAPPAPPESFSLPRPLRLKPSGLGLEAVRGFAMSILLQIVSMLVVVLGPFVGSAVVAYVVSSFFPKDRMKLR